jgi:hypothetical protein
MANAEHALQGALRPLAIITGPAPSSVSPGQQVSLSGSTSFVADGRTISTYLWSIASGNGTLTSTNTADTSVVTPNSGSVTVRLTVTDDAGRQNTADWSFVATGVGVTISPTSASVQASGGTQTFTATVTNASNTGVTWRVNGVTGGNGTVGTISTSGVYTAPASVPSPATVTVTAVSVQDPSRSASAQVTITAPAPPPPTVTVSPTTANVQAGGGTQTFSATVTNAQNTAVTWQVNGVNGGNATVGTISTSGLYSAPATVPSPATVTVAAVSVQDPTKTSSAQVTITAPPPPPPPVGVTVTPTTANVQAAGGTQAFTATVTNAQNTAVTWQVNGVTGGNATVGTISTSGVYSAPTTVPTPATVTVTATSVQDPTKTASAQVTITAPSPGGGGGAGGALDLLGLVALIAFGRRFAPAAQGARRAS